MIDNINWSEVTAGRIEIGVNWNRRRVAIPLWRVNAAGQGLSPFGLFEMYSAAHPKVGELAGHLILAHTDDRIEYVGSQTGFAMHKGGFVQGAIGRVSVFRRRWKLLSESGNEWSIARGGSGVVIARRSGQAALSSVIDPNFRCSVACRDSTLRPSDYWSKHSVVARDWLHRERLIRANRMEQLMEQLTGYSVVSPTIEGLFSLRPRQPKVWLCESVKNEMSSAADDTVIGACLLCCAWSL